MVHVASTDWSQLDSEYIPQPDFKTVLLLALASWEIVTLIFVGGHFYYIGSNNKSHRKNLQSISKNP